MRIGIIRETAVFRASVDSLLLWDKSGAVYAYARGSTFGDKRTYFFHNIRII
jgi:hypothetical protein